MSDSSVTFRTALRGYDTAQVDHHINELAHAAASAWQESVEQNRQINDLTAANEQLKGKIEKCTQQAHALEAAQRESAEPTYTGLGERIGTILRLVETEAQELRTRALAEGANSRSLAEEDALVTRQDADGYALGTRTAADDEAARIVEDAGGQAVSLLEDARQQAEAILEDARQQADKLLEDADRQARARQDADRAAMARREEAEAVYEEARAKSAAAAIDFETTLAARREASALEFAAQVTAAEHQLAAVRLRSQQARSDSEQAQQEAASNIAHQLEQASSRAQILIAEAKAKAERVRENSERQLAAATRRRDSINVQLSKLRDELAGLGAPKRVNPMPPSEVVADGIDFAAQGEQEMAAELQAEAHGLNNHLTALE